MSQQLTPGHAQPLFDALRRLKGANTSVRFSWVNTRRKSGVIDGSTQGSSVYWRSTAAGKKSIVFTFDAFGLELPITRPGSVPSNQDDVVIYYVVEGTTCRFTFRDLQGDREQTLQFS